VPTRYVRAIRRLTSLSPREWRELVRAQWELAVAQWLVWTRPQGRLTEHWQQPAPSSPATLARLADAQREATWVNRAASYGIFRPACLVRSVALARLLDIRGIHGATVRVGVRITDGKFLAHAWVEYAGQVLGDSAERIGTFAELPSLSVLHRR
jgi:transglutaminase superfamily protein